MSLVAVDDVRIAGTIVGVISEVAPDGQGLVAVGTDACQVVIVPDGATINGLRLTEDGEEWEPTDGFYFLRVAAESGGQASLALESESVSAQYRFTSPGSLRSSIPIGSVPVAIGYEAAAQRWRVLDQGHRLPVGSAVVWMGGAVPSGWLEAAAEVSRTTYAALFAVVGVTGGVGDGVTTFVVPAPGSLDLGIWIVYAGL
jgi:hypothetical protein